MDAFTVLAERFGLDFEFLTKGVAIIVLLTNLAKEYLGLKGRLALIPLIVLSFLYAAVVPPATLQSIIVGGLALIVGSLAAWGTTKIVAHKVGTPSTEKTKTGRKR